MTFVKGRSGNPRGRPRDFLNTSMKKLTRDELEEIANVLIKGNQDDLDLILASRKVSLIQKMIATVAYKILERGDMDALDKLLNRLIGKVKDTVDISSNAIGGTTVILKMPDNGRAAPHDSE